MTECDADVAAYMFFNAVLEAQKFRPEAVDVWTALAEARAEAPEMPPEIEESLGCIQAWSNTGISAEAIAHIFALARQDAEDDRMHALEAFLMDHLRAGRKVCNPDQLQETFAVLAGVGHLTGMRLLVDRYSDWIDVHHDDEEALCMAAWNGHLDVVRYLAEPPHNANVHSHDMFPFKKAAEQGHLSIVRYLADPPHNVDVHDDRDRALCAASLNGSLNVVRYLCEPPHNANIHVKRDRPVRCAVRGGHLDVVRYFCEPPNNTDIHLDGDVLLLMAAALGHLHIVRYITEPLHNADVHYDNERALMAAVWGGSMNVVRFLVEPPHSADIRARGGRAFRLATKYNHTHVLEYLQSKLPRRSKRQRTAVNRFQ